MGPGSLPCLWAAVSPELVSGPTGSRSVDPSLPVDDVSLLGVAASPFFLCKNRRLRVNFKISDVRPIRSHNPNFP